MNILGLHIGHDASACLIRDNKLVSMIERERLTRRKPEYGCDDKLINYVLGDMQPEEIDAVAVSIKPSYAHTIMVERDGKKHTTGPRGIPEGEDCELFNIWIKGVKLPAYQVQHHVAHIASGYYLSDYDYAEGISYDASYWPEEQTSMKVMCKDNNIESICTLHLNAGILYDQVTRALFGHWKHAGKTMGLAGWGKSKVFPYAPRDINNTLMMLSDVVYGFDPAQIAATAQMWLEEDIRRVLKLDCYTTVPMVVSGGTALNVVANRIYYDTIRDLATPDKKQDDPVFIPPYCTDAGIAVGSALYVLHHIHDQPREKYTHAEIAFLGRSYDNPGKTKHDTLDQVMDTLLSDQAVFWHQGRSECGPRALTHRSIFGRADKVSVKQLISEKIKGRESFRPVAPIVKSESCSNFFDIEPCNLTDFMLVNAKVLDERLVGVIHVDGTARVQTVSKEFNPVVWQLLDMMEQATGLPVLINTSLNIAGEPICETHRDTLSTFKRSGNGLLWLDGEIHRNVA